MLVAILAVSGEPSGAARIFYRIVHSESPEVADFLSNAAVEKPPRRPTPEVMRLWGGVSVYETERQAREKALRFPRLGSHLARLAIRAEIAVRIERTTRSEGHYTLWAPAAVLRSCVTGVVSV